MFEGLSNSAVLQGVKGQIVFSTQTEIDITHIPFRQFLPTDQHSSLMLVSGESAFYLQCFYRLSKNLEQPEALS